MKGPTNIEPCIFDFNEVRTDFERSKCWRVIRRLCASKLRPSLSYHTNYHRTIASRADDHCRSLVPRLFQTAFQLSNCSNKHKVRRNKRKRSLISAGSDKGFLKRKKHKRIDNINDSSFKAANELGSANAPSTERICTENGRTRSKKSQESSNQLCTFVPHTDEDPILDNPGSNADITNFKIVSEKREKDINTEIDIVSSINDQNTNDITGTKSPINDAEITSDTAEQTSDKLIVKLGFYTPKAKTMSSCSTPRKSQQNLNRSTLHKRFHKHIYSGSVVIVSRARRSLSKIAYDQHAGRIFARPERKSGQLQGNREQLSNIWSDEDKQFDFQNGNSKRFSQSDSKLDHEEPEKNKGDIVEGSQSDLQSNHEHSIESVTASVENQWPALTVFNGQRDETIINTSDTKMSDLQNDIENQKVLDAGEVKSVLHMDAKNRNEMTVGDIIRSLSVSSLDLANENEVVANVSKLNSTMKNLNENQTEMVTDDIECQLPSSQLGVQDQSVTAAFNPESQFSESHLNPVNSQEETVADDTDKQLTVAMVDIENQSKMVTNIIRTQLSNSQLNDENLNIAILDLDEGNKLCELQLHAENQSEIIADDIGTVEDDTEYLSADLQVNVTKNQNETVKIFGESSQLGSQLNDLQSDDELQHEPVMNSDGNNQKVIVPSDIESKTSSSQLSAKVQSGAVTNITEGPLTGSSSQQNITDTIESDKTKYPNFETSGSTVAASNLQLDSENNELNVIDIARQLSLLQLEDESPNKTLFNASKEEAERSKFHFSDSQAENEKSKERVDANVDVNSEIDTDEEFEIPLMCTCPNCNRISKSCSENYDEESHSDYAHCKSGSVNKTSLVHSVNSKVISYHYQSDNLCKDQGRATQASHNDNFGFLDHADSSENDKTRDSRGKQIKFPPEMKFADDVILKKISSTETGNIQIYQDSRNNIASNLQSRNESANDNALVSDCNRLNIPDEPNEFPGEVKWISIEDNIDVYVEETGKEDQVFNCKLSKKSVGMQIQTIVPRLPVPRVSELIETTTKNKKQRLTLKGKSAIGIPSNKDTLQNWKKHTTRRASGQSCKKHVLYDVGAKYKTHGLKQQTEKYVKEGATTKGTVIGNNKLSSLKVSKCRRINELFNTNSKTSLRVLRSRNSKSLPLKIRTSGKIPGRSKPSFKEAAAKAETENCITAEENVRKSSRLIAGVSTSPKGLSASMEINQQKSKQGKARKSDRLSKRSRTISRDSGAPQLPSCSIRGKGEKMENDVREKNDEHEITSKNISLSVLPDEKTNRRATKRKLYNDSEMACNNKTKFVTSDAGTECKGMCSQKHNSSKKVTKIKDGATVRRMEEVVELAQHPKILRVTRKMKKKTRQAGSEIKNYNDGTSHQFRNKGVACISSESTSQESTDAQSLAKFNKVGKVCKELQDESSRSSHTVLQFPAPIKLNDNSPTDFSQDSVSDFESDKDCKVNLKVIEDLMDALQEVSNSCLDSEVSTSQTQNMEDPCTDIASLSSITKVSNSPLASTQILKRLPPGWRREARKRLSGVHEGATDVYYYSPEGKKLRSRPEVLRYLDSKNISHVDINDFDFCKKYQRSANKKDMKEKTTKKQKHSSLKQKHQAKQYKRKFVSQKHQEKLDPSSSNMKHQEKLMSISQEKLDPGNNQTDMTKTAEKRIRSRKRSPSYPGEVYCYSEEGLIYLGAYRSKRIKSKRNPSINMRGNSTETESSSDIMLTESIRFCSKKLPEIFTSKAANFLVEESHNKNTVQEYDIVKNVVEELLSSVQERENAELFSEDNHTSQMLEGQCRLTMSSALDDVNCVQEVDITKDADELLTPENECSKTSLNHDNLSRNIDQATHKPDMTNQCRHIHQQNVSDQPSDKMGTDINHQQAISFVQSNDDIVEIVDKLVTEAEKILKKQDEKDLTSSDTPSCHKENSREVDKPVTQGKATSKDQNENELAASSITSHSKGNLEQDDELCVEVEETSKKKYLSLDHPPGNSEIFITQTASPVTTEYKDKYESILELPEATGFSAEVDCTDFNQKPISCVKESRIITEVVHDLLTIVEENLKNQCDLDSVANDIASSRNENPENRHFDHISVEEDIMQNGLTEEDKLLLRGKCEKESKIVTKVVHDLLTIVEENLKNQCDLDSVANDIASSRNKNPENRHFDHISVEEDIMQNGLIEEDKLLLREKCEKESKIVTEVLHDLLTIVEENLKNQCDLDSVANDIAPSRNENPENRHFDHISVEEDIMQNGVTGEDKLLLSEKREKESKIITKVVHDLLTIAEENLKNRCDLDSVANDIAPSRNENPENRRFDHISVEEDIMHSELIEEDKLLLREKFERLSQPYNALKMCNKSTHSTELCDIAFNDKDWSDGHSLDKNANDPSWNREFTECSQEPIACTKAVVEVVRDLVSNVESTSTKQGDLTSNDSVVSTKERSEKQCQNNVAIEDRCPEESYRTKLRSSNREHKDILKSFNRSSTAAQMSPSSAASVCHLRGVLRGWKREERKRLSGKYQGLVDIYYYTPDGKRLRSKSEVRRYLNYNKIAHIAIDNFSFSKPVKMRPLQGNETKYVMTKENDLQLHLKELSEQYNEEQGNKNSSDNILSLGGKSLVLYQSKASSVQATTGENIAETKFDKVQSKGLLKQNSCDSPLQEMYPDCSERSVHCTQEKEVIAEVIEELLKKVERTLRNQSEKDLAANYISTCREENLGESCVDTTLIERERLQEKSKVDSRLSLHKDEGSNKNFNQDQFEGLPEQNSSDVTSHKICTVLSETPLNYIQENEIIVGVVEELMKKMEGTFKNQIQRETVANHVATCRKENLEDLCTYTKFVEKECPEEEFVAENKSPLSENKERCENINQHPKPSGMLNVSTDSTLSKGRNEQSLEEEASDSPATTRRTDCCHKPVSYVQGNEVILEVIENLVSTAEYMLKSQIENSLAKYDVVASSEENSVYTCTHSGASMGEERLQVELKAENGLPVSGNEMIAEVVEDLVTTVESSLRIQNGKKLAVNVDIVCNKKNLDVCTYNRTSVQQNILQEEFKAANESKEQYENICNLTRTVNQCHMSAGTKESPVDVSHQEEVNRDLTEQNFDNQSLEGAYTDFNQVSLNCVKENDLVVDPIRELLTSFKERVTNHSEIEDHMSDCSEISDVTVGYTDEHETIFEVVEELVTTVEETLEKQIEEDSVTHDTATIGYTDENEIIFEVVEELLTTVEENLDKQTKEDSVTNDTVVIRNTHVKSPYFSCTSECLQEEPRANSKAETSGKRNNCDNVNLSCQVIDDSVYSLNGILSGWKREEKRRLSGKSQGYTDVYYYAPDGKKLRSKPDVQRYLNDNKMRHIHIDNFHFGKAARRQHVKEGKILTKLRKKEELALQLVGSSEDPNAEQINETSQENILNKNQGNLHQHHSKLNGDKAGQGQDNKRKRLVVRPCKNCFCNQAEVETGNRNKNSVVTLRTKLKLNAVKSTHSFRKQNLRESFAAKRFLRKLRYSNSNEEESSYFSNTNRNLGATSSTTKEFPDKPCKLSQARLKKSSEYVKGHVKWKSAARSFKSKVDNDDSSTNKKHKSSVDTERSPYFARASACYKWSRNDRSDSKGVKKSASESLVDSPLPSGNSAGNKPKLLHGLHQVVEYKPPKSPHGLIQEQLYHDPWKLLVASMFLNRTTGKAAKPVLWKFFKLWPTPESARNANKKALSGMCFVVLFLREHP